MHPTALVFGLWIDQLNGRDESFRAIGYDHPEVFAFQAPPEEIIEEETDEVGVVTEETIIQEEVVEEDLAISESPIEIIIDEFAPISEGDITVEQPL